jgi:hypothetical protein
MASHGIDAPEMGQPFDFGNVNSFNARLEPGRLNPGSRAVLRGWPPPPFGGFYTTAQRPPSKLTAVPVMYAARADTRKATRSANSSASATRPSGTSLAACR